MSEKFTVLIAAALGWAHDAIGLTILNFLAVPIMKDFNVGTTEMGFIFSAQYVATIFGAILFGELADKFGRKNILILSILWDAILTALSAFSPNYAVLAVLRILSGMGVSWGIAFALMSEVYSPKHRGFFGGLISATFLIGYIISAITGTILYPVYGWRPCLLVALFPIPILAVLYFVLPESRLWKQYKEMEKEVETIKPKVSLGELMKGGYLKLTILCCLLFWASEFAYHAIVDWGPTFLNVELGFEVEEASSIILLACLLVGLLLPLVGLVSDFIGRRRAFAVPAFVGFAGVIALEYFTLVNYSETYAISSLLITVAAFSNQSLYGVWSSEIFPTKVRATANSLTFSVARGLSWGGLIVGYLATFMGLARAMLISVAGFFLMTFLPWLLPETKGKELKAVEV